MSNLQGIVRELRQRLEIDRLFGWAVPIRLRGGDRGAPGPASAGSSGAPRRGTDACAEREARLEALAREVAACQACGLSRGRKQAVFGVGDPCARLLFVGEAPGYDEDRLGEPFVGKAGQLLNDIIRAMGIRREDVYIANVVKCRPPGNRTPDPGEAGACRKYLEAQIEIVAPEVIIALGGVAASALLGRPVSLGSVRGRFWEYRGIPLMPTYHPAYLLRYPEEKRKTWRDVQLVMARLGLARP